MSQEMTKWDAVDLFAAQTELTTQQAADLLRVLHPALIKMLDEGKMPYRKVGAHRWVRCDGVKHYLQAEHVRRIKVMEELIAETERLGLYE
jgi:excisionase family DNA binding protein